MCDAVQMLGCLGMTRVVASGNIERATIVAIRANFGRERRAELLDELRAAGARRPHESQLVRRRARLDCTAMMLERCLLAGFIELSSCVAIYV